MQRKWLVTAAFLALSATTDAAPAQEAYKLCKLVKEDGDRLKCFDAAVADPSPATHEAVRLGWDVKEDKAPIDDSARVIAALLGDDNKNALILRCSEGQSVAAVAFDGFLGLDDSIKVIYRIGEGAAISATWISMKGKGAISPLKTAIPLMKALPDNGKFFFRVYDFQGLVHDALFDLGNISDVRAKIAAACKWDQVPAVKPATSPKPPQTSTH